MQRFIINCCTSYEPIKISSFRLSVGTQYSSNFCRRNVRWQTFEMNCFHCGCKEMSTYTGANLHRWKRTRTYISIGSINKFTDLAATRSAVKSTACLDIRVHDARVEVSFSHFQPSSFLTCFWSGMVRTARPFYFPATGASVIGRYIPTANGPSSRV